MDSLKGTLAIIPARSGSKGLPGKNIRELAGKPLIAHSIEAGLESEFIDKVIVSTDSETIAQIAVKYGAEVPFIRPDYLATDTASSIDVVLHVVDFYETKGIFYKNIILLQPTSPLRSSKDINGAFSIYNSNNCDSVISVCKAEVHPFLLRRINADGFMQDYIEQKDKHIRRQDMETLYQLNGAIYLTSVSNLRQNHSFYGLKNIPYIMSNESSVDIDTEIDIDIAEIIMKKRL